MKFILLLFCYFTLLVMLPNPYDEPHAKEIRQKRVVISGIENEQTHIMAKEVLGEVYRRIGIKVDFKLFPGRRSLVMANDGETDGDIARIWGTEEKYTNLIPVPTPIIYFDGVAYTKSVTKEINSWEDLKGLKIGIIQGIRYSEMGTKGLNPFLSDDMTHLFTLLRDERIQIAIAILNAGKIEIHRNFKNSSIHVIGKPLYSGTLYHFVHKKMQPLIEELNQTIIDMETNGEIQKIIDDAIKHLMID